MERQLRLCHVEQVVYDEIRNVIFQLIVKYCK